MAITIPAWFGLIALAGAWAAGKIERRYRRPAR